jgi:hypothetical protein
MRSNSGTAATSNLIKEEDVLHSSRSFEEKVARRSTREFFDAVLELHGG